MIFFAATSAGCSTSTEATKLGSAQSQRSVQRDDLEKLVAGEQAFGVALYRAVTANSRENVFFSPHSLEVALSMTYAGAGGDTQRAFEQVLGSGLPEATHHQAMAELEAALSARGHGARGTEGQPFRLRSANQLFVQTDYALNPSFVSTLSMRYSASAMPIDFQRAPELARDTVNEWVARATEDRIRNILDRVDPRTRLMLANAVYFNAAWAEQFSPSATQEDTFHKLDGSTSRVMMMHNARVAATAARVNDVEIVALPYDGGELSMVFFIPPVNDFTAFERALTGDRLGSHLDALQGERIDLYVPRFETRWKRELSHTLTELGLDAAFSNNADFSRMTSERTSIGTVVHEAWVKVDERGTEAAAATVIGVRATSAMLEPPRVIRIDRPFIFLIVDHATGTPVFMGRIVDPGTGPAEG